MRAREGCSPSHHKVLMQGLDIRKSTSGRSIFKKTQVLTVLTVSYKTAWETWLQNRDVVGTSSDSTGADTSCHQQNLMKTRGATSEGCTACCGAEVCRVTSFGWAYELKTNVCWQQKPKRKDHGSSRETQKLGKELAGVAGHKTNAYFYFSLKEQSRKTVSLKQTLESWSESDLYEPVWDFMCTDLISHCHQKGQDWPCCTCPKPPLHCHQQK